MPELPEVMSRQVLTRSILWSILLIILGFIAIASPIASSIGAALVIGWLVLISGLVQLVHAFQSKGIGHIVWKLMWQRSTLGGIYAIGRPVLESGLTLVLPYSSRGRRRGYHRWFSLKERRPGWMLLTESSPWYWASSSGIGGPPLRYGSSESGWHQPVAAGMTSSDDALAVRLLDPGAVHTTTAAPGSDMLNETSKSWRSGSRLVARSSYGYQTPPDSAQLVRGCAPMSASELTHWWLRSRFTQMRWCRYSPPLRSRMIAVANCGSTSQT
jgi:hypothetical protein